jgi:hypothetical protein
LSSQLVQSLSLVKPWEVNFDQPPPAQSVLVAGAEPAVEGLADGEPVPGIRGVGELGTAGVVGLLVVSPGTLGPTPGAVDGLGEVPGVLVCASAGATLTMTASATIDRSCQDFIRDPPCERVSAPRRKASATEVDASTAAIAAVGATARRLREPVSEEKTS